MTPEQLQQLRDRIATGKQPEHKLSDARAFLRGWNEGLAYVEKCLKDILGEEAKGGGNG
jgi:hypothetical protein